MQDISIIRYILCIYIYIYTVSKKNDTDVALYDFNSHQPIFGRNVAERVHYHMCVSYPTAPN